MAMLGGHKLTRAEQKEKNLEDRTLWQNKVVWIFLGFFAVVAIILLICSLTGVSIFNHSDLSKPK